jgi:pilus assembly protein CpaB
MGRRTVLLIAALVVAALGTALVWLYASRADERAQAGAEQVQVLVATAGIAAGTQGSSISEAAAVELRTLPAAAVPAGALSDLTPVQDLVTVVSIFEGQVLLQPMFGTQVESSGGLTLPEGQMGVAVQLGDPQRVAGFVRPGSEVAIFVTSEAEEGGSQTDLLLERVQVVAVGPTTISTTTTTADGTTNAEAIPTAILTLALDQDQAQRVILATAVAPMYFALLGPESAVDADAPGTTSQNLLD